MKVIVVGPHFPDSFARNISVTLASMGCHVTALDGTRAYHHQSRLAHLWWTYAPKAFSVLERAAYRPLIRAVRTLQPELVLVTYGILPPELVRELKDISPSKIVCWFPDPISNLYRQYLLASPFDALFLKEPFLVRVLRDKLGLKSFYLPECCNPRWHRRLTLSPEDHREYGCDLAAAGTLHYYRARMLEPFQDLDLKVWGRNRPSWIVSPIRRNYRNHFVAEDTKAKAYGAAKIVLNTMLYSEIEGVNCSLFEIAGCGGFQIADDQEALPELFVPGREIVTFRTRAELRDKVDYYLAHPEQREEFAARAFARAHREHTYQARLEHMLRILGLSRARSSPVAAGTAAYA